jgi:hypothetical protein
VCNSDLVPSPVRLMLDFCNVTSDASELFAEFHQYAVNTLVLPHAEGSLPLQCKLTPQIRYIVDEQISQIRGWMDTDASLCAIYCA